MFEAHPGNVLFTLIEQIDKLAMFTSFDVRCQIVPMPTGATGRFYEVVAEAGNDTPSVLFFSDDEKPLTISATLPKLDRSIFGTSPAINRNPRLLARVKRK